MIGEKAIPTALKKATTQPVQPKVRSPKIKVRNGIAFEPFGSTFVRLKFMMLKATMIAERLAIRKLINT